MKEHLSMRKMMQQHAIKCSTWVIFLAFALLLFGKCIVFHWGAFHSILISSLWRDPFSFFRFYIAKLLMPICIASFVLISKHRWWTILVSLLVDIWSIANLIYYKTYDNFLCISDVLMIGNMGEAWSSIPTYIDISMWVLLAMTLVWTLLYIYIAPSPDKRHWIVWGVVVVITYGIATLNNYLTYDVRFWGSMKDLSISANRKAAQRDFADFSIEVEAFQNIENENLNYLPFYYFYYRAKDAATANLSSQVDYVRHQSILSYLFAVTIYHCFKTNMEGEIIDLTTNEKNIIGSFISDEQQVCHFSPKENLIVILVESMESWPLEHNIEGYNIAPYLRNLVECEHVLYCDKITSETLGGNSGDGQMIVNTGLLPIKPEVACMHYGNNTYPNYAHFYSSSFLINPWPKVWNQDTMSVRYSYNTTIDIGNSWDKQVMDTALYYLQKAAKPTCIMAITVSTHTPFNRVEMLDKVQTSAPNLLNRYLQCYNYMDSCVGTFMQTILEDSVLCQSTVVITGDHTIFKPAILRNLKEYATEQELSIANGTNYCPLIIYSPRIEGNIRVDDICYQMDIFPTILHVIGCDDYYWNGLGVNLLNTEARQNRLISEQDAYLISNWIIRGNYFGQIMNY